MTLRIYLSTIPFLSALRVQSQSLQTCGPGVFRDVETETDCVCGECGVELEENKIFLAGLFDTENFYWGEEIFSAVVEMINDHNDGWRDDLLSDGTELVASIVDAGCDPKIAAPSYWDLKTNWGKPLHGVVGCRCSGASISVSRIAGLDDVPVVSMSSSSSQLSDKDEFPSFSRLVGPDDERGQVGALVNLLVSFGWDRVSIISTDTKYTTDFSTEFQNIWTGKIPYTFTVSLTPDKELDRRSLRQAFDGYPDDDPTINSRVILLLAHSQHAFSILEEAARSSFQNDTIWVGVDAWSGSFNSDDKAWMPQIPGYIGIRPDSGAENNFHQDFLSRLQEKQENEGRNIMNELPHYAAGTMVDSIIAIIEAITYLSPDERMNGTLVVDTLRNVEFDGVSGKVTFSSEGDRVNPMYTVENLQRSSEWVKVGTVSPNFVDVEMMNICWASDGCGLDTPPSEKYKVPPTPVKTWVLITIPIISVLILIVSIKYWRVHKKKEREKKKVVDMQVRISNMQIKMEQMTNIDNELVDLDKKMEEAKRKQQALIEKRAGIQDKPDTWSDTDEILVELTPFDDQYWDVFDKMRSTMDNSWLTKVWRVQNMSLWTYYSFHKDRLEMNSILPNERSVWHGTSSLDPAIVYNDRQDGFMMQFSSVGYWGRGIYFADKSAYSDHYTFKPSPQYCTDRPGSVAGEREMFLTKLLVGNEIYMDRDESSAKAQECRNLTVPPVDQKTGLKYNSVSGSTAGSKVWIVYENGRAYPDYLIRYYKGNRDPNRTPFGSRRECMKNSVSLSRSQVEKKNVPAVAVPANAQAIFTWQFYDTEWRNYAQPHQVILETAYKDFESQGPSKVKIQGSEWEYEIEFDKMTQTNTQHINHTKRKVRRVSNFFLAQKHYF